MMEIDNSVVNYICNTFYNLIPIEQSIKQLWGYDDKNFLLVDSSDHQTYILKIINENDSKLQLTDIIDEILDSAYSYFKSRISDTECSFIVPKLIRTSANKLSTLVNITIKNANTCELEQKQCNVKLFQYYDGITLHDYVQSRESNLNTLADTYFQVGRLCAHLFEFLRTQNHLIDQLSKCRQAFSWQLDNYCHIFIGQQLERQFPQNNNSLVKYEKRSLIEKVLNEHSNIKGRLDALAKFVIHSDLSTRNILMDSKTRKQPTCLVDFGDIQVGNQLTDPAVAMLYGVLELGKNQDFCKVLEIIPAQLLLGYQSVNSGSSGLLGLLEDEDLGMMLTLMKVRLCQSLLNAQLASERDPSNTCTITTLKDGWKLLEILVKDDKYSDPIVMAKLWRELALKETKTTKT